MITLTITSPNETAVYENASSVSVPASLGRMQILPGHAESFVSLKKGAVVLRRAGKPEEKIAQIAGGECYVKNDKVTVIL